VRLGHVVASVRWSSRGVTLRTSTGAEFTADSAVVTVPVGVLQSADFAIEPALPERHAAALPVEVLGARLDVVAIVDLDPVARAKQALDLVGEGEQIGLLVVPDFFVITDTTVVKNTSSGVPAVGFSSVSYIDGYGILTVNDSSGQFYITGLLDFSTIDPLDVASAESSPDGLVRVLVDHREIWLFGTKTIEPWSNTGASPFPLERVPGALLERGCAAAQSCAKMDNSVFWLGDDRIIYRADGYQPVRISTHAIEEILRTGTVSDAYGMTYFMGGHHFYVLTLPSLGRTFAFDAAASGAAGTAVWMSSGVRGPAPVGHGALTADRWAIPQLARFAPQFLLKS
jgi:hypothetical protein